MPLANCKRMEEHRFLLTFPFFHMIDPNKATVARMHYNFPGRTTMSRIATLIASLLFSLCAAAADDVPFNVLERNSDIVLDVRYEDDNIWIKLSPSHAGETIIVRISNRNRDFYRPWFNGEIDLASSGFRGNQMWTDRVQTQANFVEYWLDDALILHLERK
jgi:hypothetical protein